MPAPKTPQQPGQRVTIRTVAEDAGVSVAAVSKVLRNAYGVSDALRQKVVDLIERLGYRPSVAARGMRGQTFTLGVLLVDIANPFLPSIYGGISDVAGEAGYKLLLGVGAARMPLEVKLIEQMIDNRLDGLILVAAQLSGETLETYARQIPTVVVGHHEPGALNFDTVNSDDVKGAEMAVEALYAKGYRDIGMLSLVKHRDDDFDVAPQREIGFTRAMGRLGLDASRIFRLDNFAADRIGPLTEVLRRPDRPRALFVWSDLDAILALNLSRQMGLRVPEDLALIGYDNSPVAALPLIDLASMDQDGRRLGRLATQALLTRIGGRKVAEHRRIEPSLVMRGSF